MCESVGKADLLSDHFDSKQPREAVTSCYHEPAKAVSLVKGFQ